jgi:nucleotide-binding universal stress UspA family protein
VKADLVVMTTHARGPVARFFLGSMADELVRRSAVPVLLVPPGPEPTRLIPQPAPEHVVVPLDGSALAEEALGPAADLARLLKADCSLLRVVEPSPTQRVPEGRQEADAWAYLGRVAGRLHEQGLTVRVRVVSARHPAEAILEEARGLKNAVIALATHGRGGVRRMLLGSIADKVVRAACCPVFVYRPAAMLGPVGAAASASAVSES